MTPQQELTIDKILLSFKELRELQRETSEQMKKTDAFLSKKFAETDEQMKKTDEQMKKTDEQMKKTDEQMKKTDEKLEKVFFETNIQMKKTDEKLERMGIHLGGISNNNGEMAEEFFFRSLENKLEVGGIKYDDITRNQLKSRHGIREEYDIMLTNGKYLEIIEVKYKFHPSDVAKLERKIGNFKKLFPIYDSFTIHGSIAGMTMPEETIALAKEKGFHALIAKGDHIEEVA